MMKIRRVTFTSLLLLLFASGFFTSQFIFGCNKSSALPLHASVVKGKELKKESISIDDSYQRKIQALTNENIELERRFELSRKVLEKAKQAAKEKESTIKKIIESKKSIPGEDLFTRAFPSNDLAVNKLYYEEPPFCDSLVNEITEYMQAGHRKDSVYESQIILFDSVLAGKDLLISFSRKAYDDLKLLFDKSIMNQMALQKENKAMASRGNRQKFKSKVLTGALLALSGFTTSYILRH